MFLDLVLVDWVVVTNNVAIMECAHFRFFSD